MPGFMIAPIRRPVCTAFRHVRARFSRVARPAGSPNHTRKEAYFKGLTPRRQGARRSGMARHWMAGGPRGIHYAADLLDDDPGVAHDFVAVAADVAGGGVAYQLGSLRAE